MLVKLVSHNSRFELEQIVFLLSFYPKDKNILRIFLN